MAGRALSSEEAVGMEEKRGKGGYRSTQIRSSLTLIPNLRVEPRNEIIAYK